MARSRNIKPGFFANDQLAELPMSTRLLFIGLWTLADREGRLDDRPKRIKAQVFPYDDVDTDDGLNQLQRAGFLLRYCRHGSRYVQIVNFIKHQTPHHKEAPSEIPAPFDDEEEARHYEQGMDEACLAEACHKHEGMDASSKPTHNGASPSDSGFLIPDSGLPIPDSPPAPAAPADAAPDGASVVPKTKPAKRTVKRAERPADVPEAVWNDFVAMREAKRAPLSETALNGIAEEAAKAGIGLAEALATCCRRGWQGFEAAWLDRRNGTSVPSGAPPPGRYDHVVAGLTRRGRTAQQLPQQGYIDVDAKDTSSRFLPGPEDVG